MPDPRVDPLTESDLPMCPECFAILDDDGSCPDADDHSTDLLTIWAERQDTSDG